MSNHVVIHRNVRLSDLVTTLDYAEAMECLGTTVTAYRKRGKLPEPIGYINNVPVWTKAQLKEYMAKRPGRGARTDLNPITYRK